MFGVVRDDNLTLLARGSHQKAVSNHYILWNFIDGTSARLASTRLQQLRVHFPNILAVIRRHVVFCFFREIIGRLHTNLEISSGRVWKTRQ